jgi:hypothetical protein
MRRSSLAYRARAANAWRAGADGVYLFNFQVLLRAETAVFSELGSSKGLASLDKDYFASLLGAKAAVRGHYPYMQYMNRETLTPDSPRTVEPGESASATIDLAEEEAPESTTYVVRLQFENFPKMDYVQVSLNGRDLRMEAGDDGWLSATVSTAKLRQGRNTVDVTVSDAARGPAVWSDLMVQVRHAPQ